MDFKLNKEFIELDNLIKVLGIAESGSQAKWVISSGKVLVNGEIENRIRRKLKAGDVVVIEGKEIRIC
ncbi:MAG TPA: RNA-binding S4 domain-containing protein [Candidatus Omnitrophota bacterium]|nr:RNA-binding S4 domain-containing protein [Candidatus Omnitrophota bacterium]